MSFLAFYSQQKTTFVTWYLKTTSITQTQRIIRWQYGGRPSVRNSIFTWAESFNLTERVEKSLAHSRSSTSRQVEQLFLSYFNRNPRMSIRRAAQDLRIYRSSTHVILRRRLHMFLCRIQTVHQLNATDYKLYFSSLNAFCKNTIWS